MRNIEDITRRPSKEEQRAAMESYNALSVVVDELKSDIPEIEIEATSEKIKIPLKALKLLVKILRVTSQGKPISIVPVATEMTTQAAAEILGCSRPHFVKLLEDGKIPFTKVGKHRRVLIENVINYKKETRSNRAELLKEIMDADEELGLYDT